MEEITFEEYAHEDRYSCIELLKGTFPESDEHTFKWRFENSDRSDPLLVCAKHKNKVVSFNSWIPWEFKYNDNIYLGYQSGESATHIEYRGRGLFGKLLKFGDKLASERGIDFLFGFPSNMSYGSFYRAGYFPVSPNYFHIRLLNPLRQINKKKRLAEFNTELNFSSMLTQKNKISPIFDYDYYNWRYNNNTKTYDIVEYIENNSKALFFLRKKKLHGVTELLLLDFQLNVFNEMFIENAIIYLSKIYSRKALFIRSFFNEYSNRGRALRKYFNVRVKSKFDIFIIKPLSERMDTNILLNYNCWDLMPHCADEL